MAGPWDDYQQSSSPASGPWSEYGSKPDAAPSPKQNTSLAGDLGTDLKRGVQKLPGIATGLADIPVAALTNKRFVDETADKLGEVTGFQPSQWAEEARDEYSPERQAGSAEIDQAWEDGTAMDVAGAYASNPGNVAGLVAESLPQMLAGGALGRGALAAARATGVAGAPTTAAQAATQGAVAGGVGEGAVIAGGTMDQIDDSVDPRRAAAAAAGAGVAGAALGVLGAKAAQRLGVLDAESAIAGGAGQVAGEAPGLARRVSGGALTEGVLEELPQSATETVIQNWAEEKDLTEGLARAAVEGTLAGSAIGAGVNVLPPRKRSEEMGLDPNAGPLSAAAVTAVDSEQALLPAPERLALPAPDQTLYADEQGNVSEQGPARDVDREQRPVPGREQPVRDFGPGMDQQVERGTVPVAGELMPAAQPDAPVQESAEPRTFDAQPERQGIPDMRESSINVDAEGNAVPGKIPTPRPADYVQGGRGMDQQAPVGKTYSNVLAAKNAIQRAGSADVLEAVQVGPKQFEVRAIAPPAASQEAPVVEPAPVQPPVADAVSAAPDAAPAAPAAPAATPTAKPAPVRPAPPQPVDRKGLPEILRNPKKMVIARMAKAAGIKKGSPGYEAAVGRLESEYERQVDDAQAALPFEQFNALNKESPEGVNRQAWTQLRKERGIETADAPAAPKVKPIKGADIDGDWASFSKDSGTISVPRAEMPQIKAEHRGAMVNFLNARGVAHAEETIAADKLKPTQAEYSTKKVEAAKAFDGGDRSILISREGHVLDGHHQWLAKRDAGEDVKVIRLDAPIRELLDTVAEFPSATVDAASAPATSNAPKAQVAKVEDFGEKIGGARKDTATPGRKKAAKETDSRPAWQRRYEVTQVVTSTVPGEAGRWVISDTRKLDWKKQPKQLRGNYATEEEAMQMLPVIAVAQKHRVLSVRDGEGTGYEIWRDVTDRKRVKVVDQVFPSREAGMEYMAKNAEAIIETNTTFGEADLPRPDSTVRQGAERRTGPVKDSAFTEAFGFRGVEFGNWNNQEERQQLLDDAYDGLMDLAEVMGIPPRAISLNGDLALAFGARGQGLSGARAHYEPGKVVINLTKLNGAGSLAHEWFHALDHYFARQDGKSSSAWAVDKDGTRALKISSNFESDAASSGFLRNNSGVREVLRDAYTDLMKTMFSKGETYVEDTARVDEFVGRSRKELADRLDEIRRDLAEQKDPTYWKRNNKPASAEQLAEFDTVAQLVRDGTALSTELRPTPGKSRSVLSSMRWTNDALEKMSEIYKAVRGRTGFNAETNGVFDRLRQTMGAYSSRLKMLADAQNGEEKVKKVPTRFAMDAKELDQGRGTDYWTTPHEMAARAFQGYVEDKVAERGGQSPFLNFGPENVGILTPWGWKRPFPAGEERKVINQAFDKLIDVIQTRETEGGNVALYSRASYRQGRAGQGSRAVPLRLQLKRLIGGWQNAPAIKVVQSIKDLPDAQRRQVERDGAFDVEGMFADGQVYLVADNLRDVKHAAFVLQHEVLGHAGLQGAYGQRLKPLLMSLYNSSADLKAQADALVQRFNYEPAVAMEEVLADMAAAGTLQQQPFWQRLVTAMRNALRSVGMNLNWSEGDIQALLANARGYIVNGRRRAGARDAFSRDGRSGRGPEIADEQGRLLSPNGKPSKLNQRQWHQVRGDNFKRWFGNWQGVATENRLDAMKPVRVKVPEDWRGLSVEGMQSKLKERLDLMVKSREVFDHPELGMIRIGRKGKEKTVSTSRDPAKMLAANALDTLLARSIYGVTDPSNEQGVMGYHRLYVPVEMDDHQAVAIFTVRQQNDGEWYYNAVAVEDGNKKRPGSYESPGAPKRPLGETPITGLGDFVRRPFSRVNPDTVSKVLDANGEPLVLYHGTAEEFSVFEQSRAGRSTGHTTAPLGIFVTSDASLAKAYAEKATDGMPGLANVMPLFASIKKPYRMSIAESQTLDTTDKAIAFRQKLEGEGYDGIQLVGSPTWIAFYNNQVKSATNNTGAFDEVDPDIRYRRSGQATLDTIEGLAGRIDTGRTADAFPELSQEARDFLNKVGTQPVVKRASEWVRERTERAATKIRQGIVDRYAALKELDEKLLGKDFIDNAIHNSSWVLARMSSAASGAMNAMLTTGRLRFDAKERVITLQDGDSSGGLAAVLSQLGPAAEVERFMGWIAANRADKLMSEGRENLFTADEIASGKQLNAGRTADGKARTMLYAKAFKEFQQYRDDVLSIAEATGVISAESRAMWRDEFYVPFYRVMNEDATAGGPQASKGLSRQEAYKKLKGGKQNLNDLLENTLMNFHHLLSASLKNQAAAQTMKNAEKIGVARVVPETRRDPKTSTFVLEKGERVFYEIDDPMVFEALTALADPGLNNLAVQTMSAFKRLFTNMTTVTPQFILANTMRDLMQASATSPTSKNLFKNTAQGLAGYRDAKTRAEMQASGGAFSFGHLYGADVNEVKASLNRTVKGAQLITDPSMIPKILRAGWRKWGDVADTAENISRAATYLQNVEEKGRLRAAYEARDIMDFSQHGGWPAVRFLIRVVPFLNARLQGLDKLYRSGVKPALLTAMGQGTASDKEAAARFATVTGALTVASIALYLANADDEEYRKLEDWQKDSYWFFRIGDNAFFLPKPFEVGAIATMAERLTEQLVDDKATGELFADRLKDMLTQTFSFSPVPQMFQPVLDIYSNTDAFTGRDIESMGMERLSKGLRSRENTTVAAEAVSAVSRALGDESPIALSPVQADHLIRGYFGTVGANAAGIIDTIWRGATGQEAPDKRWSEYQPIRRFYRDLGAPAPYSRYSTLFYDGLREANRVYADVRELQGLGRTAEAQDVGAENRNILAMRLRLNQQQRRVSNINKQMEIVKRSDNDGAWKRRELDRLTLMRNQITEQLGKQVEGVRAE